MKLTESLVIRNKTIRNRIALPPMATEKAVNGAPGSDMIEYYKPRAKDAGLVIIEHEYVSPEGMASPGQLSVASDDVIPGYTQLASAIHELGAVTLLQISHAGAAARNGGLPVIAPSAVTARADRPAPVEMTKEDIRRVGQCYVDAALRAQKAGFDGIELHSAHGYLLNQFYSPLTNKRTDEYTGSTLEGRTRFHVETLKAIREAVGDDFVIAIRFGACDYEEGGSVIEEIPYAVRAFEAAGADLIDISGGVVHIADKPGHKEAGRFAPEGRMAKENVNVPVLVTGGITTGKEAEDLLESGAADIVGVGIAFLKDPEWASKALTGTI